MELVRLTKENVENEHICCAISNNKDVQVMSKKAWLKDRLDDGLVFLKGNVRGKCFIEYIPAQFAWVPVQADGYMYIDCLWVSGQFKGHGNADILLEECARDSKQKGKKGLCIISSDKKRPFLADKKFLLHKGFEVCDKAQPYFELLKLDFEDNETNVCFLPNAKEPKCQSAGLSVYYTNQCPFTAKYVPIYRDIAQSVGVPMNVFYTDSLQKAKNTPCAVTTFTLFADGKFLTNELVTGKKFAKLCEDYKYGGI